MATLKDIATLQQELLDAPFRGITKTEFIDALESVADVQGILNISNAPRDPLDVDAVNFTCSGAFETFNLWERSTDTRGVQEQPVPGTPPFDSYRIRNGGAGNWNATARLKGQSDTNGLIRIRFAKILVDSSIDTEPFRDQIDAVAGEEFNLSFHSLKKNILADEKLIMQIRGPAGAVVTVHEAHFWVKRG